MSLIDVAFISRQRIIGRTNGSSAYLIDLAEAVRGAGMRAHLVQPSPTIMGRTPYLRLHSDLGVFETHQIRAVLKVGRHVLSLDPRLYAALARALVARVGRRLGMAGAWTRDVPNPYSVAIAWNAADRIFVRRATAGRADIAIADYLFQVEAFADLADPGVPTAIVMHDLFHARADSSTTGAVTDTVALLTRAQEIAALGKADAVIAIQNAEAGFVTENVPDTAVIVAPMAAKCVALASAGADDRLLFVGSNTAPNIVGLQWFFDQVWPLVLARRPGIRLDVAGTVHRAFGETAPAHVRFLGLVDDLQGCYARAGIVVSPLTFGSGLKVKLIEAMAQGKAIVATSVTLQGVERCQAGVLRADAPEAFADAIVRLASDQPARKALGEAALALARRDFSPDACYAPFLTWLRGASVKDRTAAPMTPRALAGR